MHIHSAAARPAGTRSFLPQAARSSTPRADGSPAALRSVSCPMLDVQSDPGMRCPYVPSGRSGCSLLPPRTQICSITLPWKLHNTPTSDRHRSYNDSYNKARVTCEVGYKKPPVHPRSPSLEVSRQRGGTATRVSVWKTGSAVSCARNPRLVTCHIASAGRHTPAPAPLTKEISNHPTGAPRTRHCVPLIMTWSQPPCPSHRQAAACHPTSCAQGPLEIGRDQRCSGCAQNPAQKKNKTSILTGQLRITLSGKFLGQQGRGQGPAGQTHEGAAESPFPSECRKQNLAAPRDVLSIATQLHSLTPSWATCGAAPEI